MKNNISQCRGFDFSQTSMLSIIWFSSWAGTLLEQWLYFLKLLKKINRIFWHFPKSGFAVGIFFKDCRLCLSVALQDQSVGCNALIQNIHSKAKWRFELNKTVGQPALMIYYISTQIFFEVNKNKKSLFILFNKGDFHPKEVRQTIRNVVYNYTLCQWIYTVLCECCC